MKFMRGIIGRKRIESAPEEPTIEDFQDRLSVAPERHQVSEPPIAPSSPPLPPKTANAPSKSAIPQPKPAATPSKPATKPDVSDDQTDAIFRKITAQLEGERVTPKSSSVPVNIWDMDDDGDVPPAPEARSEKPAEKATIPTTPESRAGSAPRRTKTRLIGFEKSSGDIVDLFDSSPRAPLTRGVKYPVGWIVVVDGPGRGECFSLLAGMSQVGRGDDQAIQLDFGDTAISRSNHAAIVYDPDERSFLIGHGGKTNIVRLNGKPLISTEELKTGDTIRIGDTILRFVALCGNDFKWSSSDGKEDDDVAIA